VLKRTEDRLKWLKEGEDKVQKDKDRANAIINGTKAS
jgi:hypothetical protein